MMREARKKKFDIFFWIDKIWLKMVHNHNHAGVKWVGEREGGEICWGDGVKLGCPPPSCATG